MVAAFDIADVNANPARFDLKKCEAINATHLRELPLDDFVEGMRAVAARPRTRPGRRRPSTGRPSRSWPRSRRRGSRCSSDITDNVDFLFLDEPAEDEASWTKAMKPGAEDVLRTARTKLAEADWKAEALKDAVLAAGEEHGLKLGKAQAPVRVAVTGRTVGLPLFESLEVLGRERSLARVDAALEKLAGRQES